MNITPQSYNLPIQTAVNPQTDSLRRDNVQREIITKPEASHHSGAEKGVASDKERGRSPAQNNEQVDFTSLRKQAEQASGVIGNGAGGDNDSGHSDQHGASSENGEQRNEQDNNGTSDTAEHDEQSKAEAFAEKQVIRNLASRDKEVRTHEMAHARVGGAYTGSPSYTFEIGPDGKKYAVEGEVSADLAPVAGDPAATIAKMKVVQAAALAPAKPSAQDVRVAASAASIILTAQAELVANNAEAEKNKVKVDESNSDKESLSGDEKSLASKDNSTAFDRHIEQTLASQEQAAPSRSLDIDARAGRIEQHYANINHAYEKSASYQFELTA
ncbi:MAG: putative metalloprotease CJM1_0395 family protein [Cognaticolwellia sp.]